MSEVKQTRPIVLSDPKQIRLKADASLPGVPAACTELFFRGLRPLVEKVASWGISPDWVSGFSGVMALGASWALWRGALAWALGGFLVSGVADLMDGWIARLQGRASDRGEVLDAMMDRVSDFGFLFALSLRFRSEVEWQIPLWGAQFGIGTITLLSAKAEAVGLVPPGGWFRRAGRTLILWAGLLGSAVWDPVACFPLWLAMGGVAVGSTLSAFSRFRWLREELRKPVALRSGGAHRSFERKFCPEAIRE